MGTLVVEILRSLIWALTAAVLAKVVISWLFVAGVRSSILITMNRALDVVLDPLLSPIRRIVPPLGMLDLTPMIALIILSIVGSVLQTLP